VNARDAMPKGGQLTIGTSSAWIDENYPRGNFGAPPGQYVCLRIEDNGCGMDSATLERIFEPFFTTKEVGKGTGLGLATVYGIVRQHQGWIEVASQVRQGTTFKIFLPAVAKPVETIAGDTELLVVEGGKETVLVVEDEPALREMVRMTLEQYGYRILEAQSGVEALKVWKEHPNQIDLLLTDMKMPEGMNGRELGEKLLNERPDLKVIYTSGYGRDVAGPDLMLKEGVMFLQKPYHPKTLAKTIRDCLDQKRQLV
jgi:CheY-like chemotaxis protein